MTPLSFFVPGVPIGKGRPRFVCATGHVFTPEKTVVAERGIAQFAAVAMCSRALFTVPVELRLIAFHLPPKSRTRKAAALPWSGFKGTRPDLDNIEKTVKDALNGVVWADDGLVAACHKAKVFGEQSGLLVTIGLLSRESWPFGGQHAVQADFELIGAAA